MKKKALKEVLAAFDSLSNLKHEFCEREWDSERDEPRCGYQEWDEAITDYNYELAWHGEMLAEAVREALK